MRAGFGDIGPADLEQGQNVGMVAKRIGSFARQWPGVLPVGGYQPAPGRAARIEVADAALSRSSRSAARYYRRGR